MHVTMRTFQAFMVGSGSHYHLMDEILMTMNAISLQDVGVLLVNADRFMKVLQGEALGMPEAILGLGEILADELVRQMAIDAGGSSMMTRLLPSIVLFTHDVAVDASFGVAAEVRKSLAVVDGVGTRSKTETQQDPNEKTRQAAAY